MILISYVQEEIYYLLIYLCINYTQIALLHFITGLDSNLEAFNSHLMA